MLSEFLTWWADRLLSLFPHRLRSPADRPDAARLTLAPALDRVEATLRGRPPHTAALDAPGLAALRTALGPRIPAPDLVLPPGRVLEQTVTLPLAAERDPARVLRYEMDRLTPFAAADLFWTFRVQSRDRVRNTISLRLSLTLRAPLLPVLEALAAAGLRPTRLRAGTTAIPLDPARRRPWQRGLRWSLAALCALLACGAVAVPFARQSRESRSVERRIAAMRPATDQVDALRRRAMAAAAGIDVLAAQRADSGSVLDLVAALTAALPDDTSLTDLAYRARVATVSGRSANAVRLIALLSADPALRNPSFTAPVTRNDTTRSEGFTLRTELAP